MFISIHAGTIQLLLRVGSSVKRSSSPDDPNRSYNIYYLSHRMCCWPVHLTASQAIDWESSSIIKHFLVLR